MLNDIFTEQGIYAVNSGLDIQNNLLTRPDGASHGIKITGQAGGWAQALVQSKTLQNLTFQSFDHPAS